MRNFAEREKFGWNGNQIKISNVLDCIRGKCIIPKVIKY